MQFKHPELLYALFLLLIPIFIHLFQLRRFQKVDFTNVAFLKKVTIQTRKSSQLKKWLTMLLRLLALACLILAFAQPFTASKTALNTNKETVLYVDNSFSMQVKGQEGPLLQRALQQLYSQALGNETLSWFTNTENWKNVSSQDFKNTILSVDYVQKQLSPSEILLKADQLFTKEKTSEKRLIIISDFQQKASFPEITPDIKVDAVHLQPVSKGNISIDTAYVSNHKLGTTQLKVAVSAQEIGGTAIPVSLYNDHVLIAKTAADFSVNRSNTLTFDIDTDQGFQGKLELNEANLMFDNSLYFNVNLPKKIKVLSINETNANFLQRIFDTDEFEYTQQSHRDLNYSTIPQQNLIVLNELINIPESLGAAIKSYVDQGGSLFIIPSEKSDITSYNSLLLQMNIGSLSEKIERQKSVTQIVFNHPLYKDVFEKEVVNFQYPKVNSFYPIASQSVSALKFEDGKPFILQQGNCYLSTAPLNGANSNYQSSPLIVPTLYNMARLSLSLPKLYYHIGKQNHYAVVVQLLQDEILTLRDSISNTIPLQQTKSTKVEITTMDDPSHAGIFDIEKDDQVLEKVAYNFSRDESNLTYAQPEEWQGVSTYSSVNELFNLIAQENAITSFWKWFVILALLFLALEMLVLKFYKN